MRSFFKLSFPAVAAALLLAACGGSSSASSAHNAVTVKATPNSSLGSTVLVDQQGLTLYRLSGEQVGNFICTAACLKTWHPLTIPLGAKPVGGVGGLGVIKRPDGKQQVTYKGMPLYTFAQDQSPGQAKGQGIKDVGTWNAVGAGGSATGKPPAPSAPASSGARNYAY